MSAAEKSTKKGQEVPNKNKMGTKKSGKAGGLKMA
jgi:hypothetical protein